MNSDPEVMRYLTGGKSTPREVIRDEIIPFHLGVYQRLDRLGTWAAESAGEFLGWFHLRPDAGTDITNVELGYRLRRPAWNKGYATEGSRALIGMGFTDLGVQRVFAQTMTVNTASRRVMEKCGLTLVRTFPYEGTDPIEGAEHGEVEYALTRETRTDLLHAVAAAGEDGSRGRGDGHLDQSADAAERERDAKGGDGVSSGGLPEGCPSIIPPAPGYHPARVGGSWLLRTLLPSGLRAVVVPSGFSVTVQPSWWMQIW